MLRLISGYVLVLIAVILPSRGDAAAEPDPAGLRSILSKEEFSRAGLGKLTPAELAALETALAQRGLAIPAVTEATVAKPARAARKAATPKAETADFGAEQVTKVPTASTPNELRSRIEGTLEEFSGRAVFVLENGQVWQQRNPETVHFARKLVNPEVVITRGLGGYKMVIVPADRVVFVKRIQ